MTARLKLVNKGLEMGLVDGTQESLKVGGVVAARLRKLADYHGVDAGEYRRHLITRASVLAAAEFKAATGIDVDDWVPEKSMRKESEANGQAIALIRSLLNGEEPDPKTVAAIAHQLKVSPHELAKLKKEGNGHAAKSTR